MGAGRGFHTSAQSTQRRKVQKQKNGISHGDHGDHEGEVLPEKDISVNFVGLLCVNSIDAKRTVG
jgi:hypothetical protein